jgi:hypothetical protein
MDDPIERTLPFLFTILCYGGAYYVLSRTSLTLLLTIILLGAILSLILLMMITKITKASAHCVGIGGVLGSMLCIQGYLHVNLTSSLLIMLLISGLVGTSRLLLNAHNQLQVYLGYGIGIVGQVVIFTTYKYFIFSN